MQRCEKRVGELFPFSTIPIQWWMWANAEGSASSLLMHGITWASEIRPLQRIYIGLSSLQFKILLTVYQTKNIFRDTRINTWLSYKVKTVSTSCEWMRRFFFFFQFPFPVIFEAKHRVPQENCCLFPSPPVVTPLLARRVILLLVRTHTFFSSFYGSVKYFIWERPSS